MTITPVAGWNHANWLDFGARKKGAFLQVGSIRRNPAASPGNARLLRALSCPGAIFPPLKKPGDILTPLGVSWHISSVNSVSEKELRRGQAGFQRGLPSLGLSKPLCLSIHLNSIKGKKTPPRQPIAPGLTIRPIMAVSHHCLFSAWAPGPGHNECRVTLPGSSKANARFPERAALQQSHGSKAFPFIWLLLLESSKKASLLAAHSGHRHPWGTAPSASLDVRLLGHMGRVISLKMQ